MSADLNTLFLNVLAAVEGKVGIAPVGGPVARKGLCPAHDDDKPSLSIRQDAERGMIYLRCFSGCQFDVILEELSLSPSDLRTGKTPSSGKESLRKSKKETPPAPVLSTSGHKSGKLGTEIVRYLYADEDGKPLYYNVRFEPKDFRLANAKGQITNIPRNTRFVPYRLPELLDGIAAGRRIWWVEGEKDVDRLYDLGETATTTAGGASRPMDPEWAPWFQGVQITIIQDNDKPGRVYARAVANLVVNDAASVRIVGPAVPQPKADLSDHLDSGYGLDALVPVPVRNIRRTRWTLSDLMDTKPVPLRWVLPGIIPEGLVLLVGAPKAGKSWWNVDLMVALATGRPDELFGWGEPMDPSPSLYLALEDPHRRLHSRLHQVQSGLIIPNRKESEIWLTLDPLAEGGRAEIERYLDRNTSCRCIMVDVLAKVRGDQDVQGGLYQADYEAVGALKDIADDYGIAVVVTHHDRKKTDDDYINTVSGTKGITGAADTILMLKRERGSDDGRLYVESRDVDEAKYDLKFLRELGRWQILGRSTDAPNTPAAEPIADRIMNLLILRGPSSVRDIASHLDMDVPSVARALKSATDSGHLIRKGTLWDLQEAPRE